VTEADVQRDIVTALKAVGAIVIRMNAGKGRLNQYLAPAGTPDLLVIGKHRKYWVEVKSPSGKLRPEQEAMHGLLRSRGEEVVVARGIDDLIFPV